MYADITEKQADINRLCEEYHVQRLAIFGSALGDSFDPEHSDLDFLVDFESMSPEKYADAYFGLLEELQSLFKRPIDLVSASSLRNPWLRREVELNQSLLYAA
ncbi:nucleotidyltransferase family protein [Thiohalophilus sp.]|uniref:nucleotidyltransferase family protein n=1 Tax=Thiohalophilus sp. TaxID=3028392 RepID=UPI002ACE5182|nr:nucleotidyltransferase domain-containing protein [Thiohalophilus sp.]MDZ7804365.1 nucleotidyltransferase domain-containing protein [Thiohalophilus sp.]